MPLPQPSSPAQLDFSIPSLKLTSSDPLFLQNHLTCVELQGMGQSVSFLLLHLQKAYNFLPYTHSHPNKQDGEAAQDLCHGWAQQGRKQAQHTNQARLSSGIETAQRQKWPCALLMFQKGYTHLLGAEDNLVFAGPTSHLISINYVWKKTQTRSS